VVAHEFKNEILKLNIDHSEFGEDRLVRCHGQVGDSFYVNYKLFLFCFGQANKQEKNMHYNT
jgi:hypothetical protein